jgi:hypothetical protein
MSTRIKLEKLMPLFESDKDYNGRIELKHFKQGYYDDDDGKRYPIQAVKMLMKDLRRGQVFRPAKPDGTFSSIFSTSVNAPNANSLWARYKAKGKDKAIYVPYNDATGEFVEMSSVEGTPTKPKNKKVMAYNVFINDWRNE